MSAETNRLHLPKYDDFVEALEILDLDISASELHGIMCGYLCAGADSQGEAYLRALVHQKDKATRSATLAMFAVFTVSQQQISNFDFIFEMVLPDDDEPLKVRAQAFSEWCEGFIEGLDMAEVGPEQFDEEEAQEAFHHLIEFSDLDCKALDINEEDEKALMEVAEYARMAVIRLYSDLLMNKKDRGNAETTH